MNSIYVRSGLLVLRLQNVQTSIVVPTLLDILISNFNSIKVRLKQQFQKDPLTYLKFQFHKGTIKTNLSLQKTALYKHFNSIKVRLKRLGSYAGKGIGLFQFHKGTIKTSP